MLQPVTDIMIWPVFVLGLLFGSFLNVVGYRVPRGESIVWPGSHCTNCNRLLKPYELIPVLSFVFLRGRCRTCHSKIPVRYPAVELVTACLFAATLLYVSQPFQVVTWCLFWMLMAAVTATDITAMRVPNVLSLPGAMVVGVSVILTGVQTLTGCLVGAAVGFFMMLLIQVLSGGKMGMGDVKLYISIGAILGPMGAVESLIFASLAGSVVGLSLRAARLLPPKTYIPFVPFILIGAILVAFFGPAWFHYYTVHMLHLS